MIVQGRRNHFESEGAKYVVSKEAPPWLGPMGEKMFWKIDLSDWLKHTLNQVYTLKYNWE